MKHPPRYFRIGTRLCWGTHFPAGCRPRVRGCGAVRCAELSAAWQA